MACYGNIDFIWYIEYSWREEGGDCTDDSRSIAGISVATLTIAALVSSKTSLANMAPWWGFHKSDAIAPWAYVGFDTIPQAAEEFKFSYKRVS